MTSMKIWRNWSAGLVVLFWLAAGLAWAQTPAESTGESPAIARLNQQIVRLAERIAVEEQALAALPAGSPTEALDQRIRLLRWTKRSYENQLNSLESLSAIERDTAKVRDEIASFTGLPEPPPYTIDMVDALRDAVDARQAVVDTESRNVERAALALEKAEADVRSARTAASAAGADEAARMQAAMAEAIVEEAKARLELAKRTAALRVEEKQLAEKRAAVAPAQLSFTYENLQKLQASIEERRKTVQKDLDKARTTLDRRLDARAAALTALAVPPDPSQQEMAQAQFAAVSAELDAARTDVTVLETVLGTFDNEATLWPIRQRVVNGLLQDGFAAKVQAVLSELDVNEPALRSELATVQTQLGNPQDTSPGQSDALSAAATRIANALHQRETRLEDGLSRLAEVRKLARRIEQEINEKAPPVPWQERIAKYHSRIREILDYAPFSIGDNPISLGKVVSAFLVFTIGLFVSRRVARAAGRVAQQRFHADQNAALSFEKVLFYVLIVFVLLFTLSAVRIPLTVFTFFGGAVAIGVGFGAQNLISNFISGLILLFERPIKIGDVVEVEGKTGRIENIGARCSRLRLFNGIDILVPNSAFLEKSVTNWTLSDAVLRGSVELGVVYGSPVRLVSKLMCEAAADHSKILKRPEPTVVFKDFGDNALVFELFFWLDLAKDADMRSVSSDLRYHIESMFREAGIAFAAPQRDITVSSPQPLRIEIVPPDTDPETPDKE